MARIEFRTLDTLTGPEAYQLFRLRVDVFVAEQACPYAELDDVDAAPSTYHVLAWDEHEQLVSCARVFPTSDGSQFGRFIVTRSARGSGLGPNILRACIEFTRRWPGDLVLNAQAGLVDYYSQFGFAAEGEEFLDTGIPHRRMRLTR